MDQLIGFVLSNFTLSFFVLGVIWTAIVLIARRKNLCRGYLFHEAARPDRCHRFAGSHVVHLPTLGHRTGRRTEGRTTQRADPADDGTPASEGAGIRASPAGAERVTAAVSYELSAMSKIKTIGRKLLLAISAVFLAKIGRRRFLPYGRIAVNYSLLTVHCL